jgi:lysophospholipase L1-like esterase
VKARSTWLLVVVVMLSSSLVTVPAQAADFFCKDGDVVVVMGDSITEQHLYSNYLEMWTVSRFPSWKLTFGNVGIGGDRSTGGNGRFQRDVTAFKPTALTVDFGMNDGNYRAFDDAGFKTYMGGLQGIANQAKAQHLRVAWITPSPVEKAENGPALQGYNETLEKYSEGVKTIAERNEGLFVDQFHPFVALQDKARAANPKNRIGGGDPVHPGPPGQAVMAWAILKGLHFPCLVSSVAIDAAAGKVTQAQQCEVSGLEVKDGRVSFQRHDAALPFFPEQAKSILEWAPIRDELNDYRLQVTGLPSGRYAISLGGKRVTEHSAEELDQGVNLAAAALAEGPVADQVKAVWNAVEAKNRFYHDRIFRGIVLSFVSIPDYLNIKLTPQEINARREAAIKERLAKLPEMDEVIRKALIIKPHLVEIAPAGK